MRARRLGGGVAAGGCGTVRNGAPAQCVAWCAPLLIVHRRALHLISGQGRRGRNCNGCRGQPFTSGDRGLPVSRLMSAALGSALHDWWV